MTAICITGSQQQDLDHIARLLHQAGMAPARPARGDPTHTMNWWHAEVCAQAAAEDETDAHSLPHIDTPGRLWDQLASDIFLANLGSSLWGWADTRSIALLDYWLQFQPKLQFVLVCTRPEVLIGRMLRETGALPELSTLLSAWYAQHEALLRFQLRNPERSLLVDASACAAQPEAIVTLLNQRWPRLRLKPFQQSGTDAAQPGALEQHLAQLALASHDEVADLQREIDAALPPLPVESNSAPSLPAMDALLADYRLLQDRSAEAQRVSALENEVRRLQDSSARELGEARNAQEQTQRQLAEARKAHDEQSRQLSANEQKLKEQQQENETLLMQLHQVQEELEAIFLEREALKRTHEQLGNARTTAEQELAAARKSRDEQSKLAAERHAQLEQLNKTKTMLEQELAAARKARDEQSKLAADRHTQLEQLNKTKAALEQELANARKAQAEASKESSASLERHVKEQREENELLLLQLHQVQEELEHYFLQHQAAQKQIKDLEQRMQALLDRNPAYTEFSEVHVQPGGNASIEWRFTQARLAGRHFPELKFRTVLENGVAGLVFERQGKGSGALLQWPAAARDNTHVELLPMGQGAVAQTRITALAQLATGDWNLLQAVAQLLQKLLSSDNGVQVPPSVDRAAHSAGLNALEQILAKFPNQLRVDRVALKREQVNPDYEHLWFELKNLSFGKNQWPHFEFRLSCAHVAPGKFGLFPKLEFPEEGSQAPFKAWYVEASDDFGPKLELRFSVKHGLDMAVWNKLAEQDRQFIRILTQALPAQMAALEAGGFVPQRAWKEWLDMVRTMQQILAQVPNAEAPHKAEAPTAGPQHVDFANSVISDNRAFATAGKAANASKASKAKPARKARR